ncbi:hypothetical protein Neosp_004070 [[Neocosmospora] mangrovei]
MVKSYFFAPDFSTGPPPEGPIRLGSILRNITELYPINETVQPIPEAHLYPVDKKTGFEISLRELHSADFSLKAKLLELFGVGCLETIAFNPTESYIKDGMKDPGVVQFMESNRTRAPVYMVTGIKIARGGSSTSTTTSRAVGIETDVGLVPPGTPLELGVKFGYSRSTEEGEGWRKSITDHIVSFRVRKIWRDRKGRFKHKAHNEMAVMLSAASSSDESDDDENGHDIRWDDDLTLEEINEMFSMAEDVV